ncbi:DUF881 domain-containing protein [Jiangella asiatica]|uniref:DUF881 domain-containing protein n=1 Tax=Jiangella asiatica TaxID=2530372 RepID=A0A4V2Z3G8_9ACTN|nr:DUF881 domain-containing protein [Jiangella asiatica]TDE12658.1 DUF881 domain-containing protein [Jiangella asiatica]
MVLAFCGLLLVISARAADGDDLRGSDILELSDLVRAEERRVQELEAQVADLTKEIEDYAADNSDSQTDEVNRQIEEMMPEAGLTPVEGPALSVTLDDAPLPANLDEESDDYNVEDYLVHQQDLQGVVNALWAGGAEAMTVMDQRIVSTSTIRCVGSVLLLHGRTFYPPYTITAIGDADAMRDALGSSPAVREYRSWADLVGLRYDVADEGTVTMPAYTGTIGGGSTS